MTRFLTMAAIVVGLLFLPHDASACERDFECPAGSRCVKRFGELDGVCQRGVSPDPRRDQGRPTPGKARTPGRAGAPCEFQTDCGPGLSCVSRGSSSQRVCSR